MPQGCSNYQGYLQVMITITEKGENYKIQHYITSQSSHELVFGVLSLYGILKYVRDSVKVMW